MARIEVETAKKVSQAWGVFVISKDGAKVEPCEAYALDGSGNFLSGDGDDITAHVAKGGAFVTYEGHATEAAAKASADEANASYARGVANFGWNDNGARYEARPLPAGTLFHLRDDAETLCVVSPAVSIEVVDNATPALQAASAALARIAGVQAAPMVAVVVTRYDDGTEYRHEVRSLKAAANWAIGERRKIGRSLIDRKTGKSATVIAVDILPL